MKRLINSKKPEFYRIFNNQKQGNINFITGSGKLTYDEVIDFHLKSWVDSRINGVSDSMAFYAEIPEAITLLDKIAKEYFLSK